jgi:ribosomal protein L30/L7E
MKPASLSLIPLAALCATLSLPIHAATDPGLVDFGVFDPPETGEFVEVQIKSNLINMVARVAKGSEPEIAELLGGLRFVRVNVLSLTDDNRDQVLGQIKKVREQLETTGWDRVVTALDNGDDIAVFMKLRGDEAVEGIVVTVLDGDKEAVLVNVAGDVRPEKLAVIGERFDIEPLKNLGGITKKS